MSSSSYNGVGYDSSLTTIGTQNLEQYVNYSGNPANDFFNLQAPMLAEANDLLGAGQTDAVINNFLTLMGFPANAQQLNVNFTAYLTYLANGNSAPGAPAGSTPAQQVAYLANSLQQSNSPNLGLLLPAMTNNFIALSGLNNWTVSINGGPPQTYAQYVSSDPTDAQAYAQSLFEGAYTNFMTAFQPNYSSSVPLSGRMGARLHKLYERHCRPIGINRPACRKFSLEQSTAFARELLRRLLFRDISGRRFQFVFCEFYQYARDQQLCQPDRLIQ